MYDLGKLIKQLRSEKDVSMDKMCDDFLRKYNVSLVKSTISKWENNRAEPSLTNAKFLADYFNVTLDYILGIEQYKISVSKDEKELLNIYDKLNDTGKKEAIKRISELTEINKYTESSDKVFDIETLKNAKSLEELTPTTLAAHDDDLTDSEKTEMDKRILEALKKKLGK